MHPFVPLTILVLSAFPSASATPTDSALLGLRQQAQRLAPLVHTKLAREFLTAAGQLPPPPVRTIYRDSSTGAFLRAAEVDSAPASLRARLSPRVADGLYYYETHYGSLLNYLRLFELLGANGITGVAGKRVLDFGYGRIGHLQILANLGATVVGVDVDPELRALYIETGDHGRVQGPDHRDGSVVLVNGFFPGDPATRQAVGGSYDIVISKNTLKGGHEPAERARQSQVINLGVPDSTFLTAIFDSMSPRGLLLMYTVSGPRGNAHCPFSEGMVRAAGFEIIAYDRDDSDGARAVLQTLHRGRPDPPSVAFEESTALYTILRKP